MTDDIRQAASDSMSKGEDIRRRVHDITLEALTSRHFDRDAMREVVRAVTEGMVRGAEGSDLGVRHALAEGFRGMDQALSKSVQAGHEAFAATVDQVAHSANERVRPELRELLRQSAHAGTETGRQTARLMAEFTLTSIELAGDFSARFAHLASGVLAGMADALDKSDRGRKSP